MKKLLTILCGVGIFFGSVSALLFIALAASDTNGSGKFTEFAKLCIYGGGLCILLVAVLCFIIPRKDEVL